MAKLDCMLAIVWLLRSHGRMTARELAEVLEISVRSVYRYIDSLCVSGVPIEAESGHSGGYRLSRSHDDAPLFFTTEEKTALVHSALFAQNGGYPFTAALTSALQKIEHHSTREQLEDVSLHSDSVHVVAATDHSAYRSTLVDLERAITHRQTMTIKYHKPKSETNLARHIDPYGLIHWRDRWYVVAHCHLRGDTRTFRVDRITEHEPTSATFVHPEGFSASDFFVTHQVTTTADTDSLRRVLLEGDHDAIDELVKHWFTGSRLVRHSANEALFLMEEETLVSFVPYILLPFGRSIRIAEPASLKRRMLELVSELVSFYGQVD